MRVRRITPAALFLFLAACGGEVDTALKRPDGTPLLGIVASSAGTPARDLRTGQPAVARAALEASLARDPEATPALNDLALAYAMEGRLDAARQLLEEAMARGGPGDQQAALVNLGELYGIEGYLTAAEAYLSAARAIDPARAAPSYALAALADARNDPPAVASALQSALAADPTGAERAGFLFLYPEEQTHLAALVAEASLDAATAAARWRELARGRFTVLVTAAQRHLEVAGAP